MRRLNQITRDAFKPFINFQTRQTDDWYFFKIGFLCGGLAINIYGHSYKDWGAIDLGVICSIADKISTVRTVLLRRIWGF